jgi:TonB family protein
MTRLEKKCLVGAATMHGLLLVVLVAASAFQGEPPKPQSFARINWIPSKTVDTPSLMAGNPNVTPAAVKAPTPTPSAPAAQPAPEKPQPKVEKTEPPPEKTEVKATKQPKHEVEPDLSPIESPKSTTRSTRATHKIRQPTDIKVDLGSTAKIKPIKRPTRPTSSDDNEVNARAAAAAQRRAASEITQAFSGLATAINKGTAKAEVFDLVGQGGGAAFADYRTVLFNAYYNAWTCPQDVDNDLLSVEVKIVVARNGSIISAEITKKSSDSSLNRSVQRALDNVRKLPAFPDGANDDQRSFKLRFNLKAKQSLG